MCIEEFIVPFTGRLFFKQYLKNKRHKYGIKLFKLCIPPNYTVSIKVYAGKETTSVGSVASNIMMELVEPFLNFGRTLILDNWYTSVELAEKLGEHNTYLIGTLRSNRKSNPRDIVKHRLKKKKKCVLHEATSMLWFKNEDTKGSFLCVALKIQIQW